MFATPETVELDQSAANVISAIESFHEGIRRSSDSQQTKEHEQVLIKRRFTKLSAASPCTHSARMAPGIALGVMSDIDESLVLDPMMGSGTGWLWPAPMDTAVSVSTSTRSQC